MVIDIICYLLKLCLREYNVTETLAVLKQVWIYGVVT